MPGAKISSKCWGGQ